MLMRNVKPGTLFRDKVYPNVLFRRAEDGSLVNVFGILCEFNAIGLEEDGANRSYWNLRPDADVVPVWN